MKKVLNTLFRGIEILIAVFLAVMIILTFMNVVMRYAFSKGFAWSEEIARLCFIYLVYLGSIEAMRDNRHLIIDSVLGRLPPVAGKALYAVLQVVIVWLMYILTVGSWRLVVQNMKNRWVATQFPSWLVFAVGLVMGVSIAILAVVNIVHVFTVKGSVHELLAIRDSLEDSGDGPKTQEVG